jgi:hypothetical protein
VRPLLPWCLPGAVSGRVAARQRSNVQKRREASDGGGTPRVQSLHIANGPPVGIRRRRFAAKSKSATASAKGGDDTEPPLVVFDTVEANVEPIEQV